MIRKIIPTIFALNEKEFNNKLKNTSFLKELHIDFMDGKFVENKSVSINNMKNILNYPKINFQIHLMSYNPSKYLNKIKKYSNIKTILFHIEAFYTTKSLINTIEKYKTENYNVGLVLNPDTKTEEILFYIDKIDLIMYMSVWPGKEGQIFIEKVLSEIIKLRKKYPLFDIQIDGGIDEKNITKIINSGVNNLCIGSYISKNKKPKETYNKLNNIINT